MKKKSVIAALNELENEMHDAMFNLEVALQAKINHAFDDHALLGHAFGPIYQADGQVARVWPHGTFGRGLGPTF
jgi:hypothetical protein